MVARVVESGTAPAQLRAAAALVGLEGLALLGVAAVLVAKTFTGHPDSVGRALLGAAMALTAAAALGLGAHGLLRVRAAARTPMMVLQALALPVGYGLAFQAALPGYGGPILVAAVSVLFLLFTPPVRAALDREPE